MLAQAVRISFIALCFTLGMAIAIPLMQSGTLGGVIAGMLVMACVGFGAPFFKLKLTKWVATPTKRKRKG